MKDVHPRLIKKGRVMNPRCLRHQANRDPLYGVLPCNVCKKKSRSYKGSQHIPEYIRQQQKEHHNDFVQPHKVVNGKPVVNEEFVKLYPDKAHTYYTPEEMKKAGMPKLIDYGREVKYKEAIEKQKIEAYKQRVIQNSGNPRDAMKRLLDK